MALSSPITRVFVRRGKGASVTASPNLKAEHDVLFAVIKILIDGKRMMGTFPPRFMLADLPCKEVFSQVFWWQAFKELFVIGDVTFPLLFGVIFHVQALGQMDVVEKRVQGDILIDHERLCI
jgi:hypothetical protein